MRACIGRPFAWQEAQLCVVMLLQNFDFTMDDPSYQLEIKQTLTIKPKDFFMRASLRRGHVIAQDASRSPSPAPSARQKDSKPPEADSNAAVIDIYYGSNTGTCESMANSLASSAAAHGYKAHVDILDKALDVKPNGMPKVIITASYEGEPPDNATHFVNWLQSSKKELSGVRYAVFGCGNRKFKRVVLSFPGIWTDVLQVTGLLLINEFRSS